MNTVAELEGKRVHQNTVVEERMEPGNDRDFVVTLAHEIRNVLSPLGGSLELLNMEGIDEMSASQARGVIGRQVRQLRRLVNDLLDAHRIEYRQIQIITSLTELATALEAICEDHRPVFVSRGITLTLNVMIQPLWIKIDVDRLDQALNNLLSNSLKFTDSGGSVCVGLSIDVAKHCALISVRDTGIGIEPAIMHAIFDRHAHDVSRRNASGLGLGLFLVKRLVELHGGQLAAHSDGLGKGTEFRILLPLPT